MSRMHLKRIFVKQEFKDDGVNDRQIEIILLKWLKLFFGCFCAIQRKEPTTISEFTLQTKQIVKMFIKWPQIGGALSLENKNSFDFSIDKGEM